MSLAELALAMPVTDADVWEVRRCSRAAFFCTPTSRCIAGQERRVTAKSSLSDQMAKAARHSVKTRPDRSAAIQAKVTATVGGK